MDYYKPFPDEFFRKISKDIFAPIVRGESAYVRWFPGHGKTVRLHQLLSDKKLLEAGLGSYSDRFLLLYLNTADFGAARPAEFFYYVKQAIAEELAKHKLVKPVYKTQAPTSVPPLILTLKRIIDLSRIAVDKGREIIFLIDMTSEMPQEYQKEFFAAWEQIVESHRERIHTHIHHLRLDLIESGLVPAVLMQEVVSVPLPNKEECRWYINFFIKEWNIKFTTSDIQTVSTVCGHDLWLIKEAMRIYERSHGVEVSLLREPTLLLKAQLTYRQYSRQEQAAIAAKVKTNTVPYSLQSTAHDLVTMRFWDGQQKAPKIIEHIILKTESVAELTVDAKTKSLHLGSLNMRHTLSETEHSILSLLFRRKEATAAEGKIVSRDEVGEIIWGTRLLENYSDWAIDKAISRVRTKLGRLTPSYRIVTKKKAGFYLSL